MFDSITVVDVEQGTLVPGQRVVIVGSRIQAVGPASQVRVPPGAQVVAAQGKYLMPGLWDMHFHTWALPDFFYPLALANGVTGIREMGIVSSTVGITDSMLRWRRELAAGVRIGPRAVATGQMVAPDASAAIYPQTPAEGRRAVDSLKALGVDHVKVHSVENMSRDTYFAILNEGRRIGIPVVGHPQPDLITLLEASDSGLHSLEHLGWMFAAGLDSTCSGEAATDGRCDTLAAHFRRNDTWMVPTVLISPGVPSTALYSFLPWLPPKQGSESDDTSADEQVRYLRAVMRQMLRAGVPLLAGVDASYPPPYYIHDELSALVKLGLTPLQALQAAILNPARYLHGTDSLGTVAAGKLADLVVLDADPLANIHHTAAIRAVVANGRYFDRPALDSLLAEVRAKVTQNP